MEQSSVLLVLLLLYVCVYVHPCACVCTHARVCLSPLASPWVLKLSFLEIVAHVPQTQLCSYGALNENGPIGSCILMLGFGWQNYFRKDWEVWPCWKGVSLG